jgi:hypothetical protein
MNECFWKQQGRRHGALARVTAFCSLTRQFRVLIRDYQTIIEKIPCIFFLGEAVCSVQISRYAFLIIPRISAPAGNFAFSPANRNL